MIGDNEKNWLSPEEKKVFDRLLNNTKKHLERVLPGEIDRLDWEFFRKFKEPFIIHLFNNPEETINQLMDYEGADILEEADKTKYILYMVLKSFFLNNRRYAERALNSLLSRNWNLFREIVKEFIQLMAKTSTP